MQLTRLAVFSISNAVATVLCLLTLPEAGKGTLLRLDWFAWFISLPSQSVGKDRGAARSWQSRSERAFIVCGLHWVSVCYSSGADVFREQHRRVRGRLCRQTVTAGQAFPVGLRKHRDTLTCGPEGWEMLAEAWFSHFFYWNVAAPLQRFLTLHHQLFFPT